MRVFLISAVVIVATALFAVAAPKEDSRDEKAVATTEPKGLPLELRIVSEGANWQLDTRGEQPFKFQQMIREGEKSGALVPATRVELQLEIRNTGISEIRIWVGGDDTLLSLDLQGTGPMMVSSKVKPTPGVVPPVVVTIPAGKSHKIPLTSLAHGFRNQAKHTYITEIGDYQLSATYKTAVSPAPSGSRRLAADFGEVILKSAPIEFYVKRPS